jgi:spermidine synthase
MRDAMTRRVRIAILTMGFSGLVAEILLLRELLIVFSGNELSIGIILSNWLILGALGSWWAGRRADAVKIPLEAYTAITLLFSLSTLAAIYLARILKLLIGVSIGESIGFVPMVYTSFLILLPVSLLHGARFTYSCRIYAEVAGRGAAAAGRVYIIETVGAIIGGVASTYLLIPYLNSFQAAAWLVLINVIACLALFAQGRSLAGYKKTAIVGLAVIALSSAAAIVGDLPGRLHVAAVNAQWPNQKVVHYQNSPYGNVAAIENQGQYTFFLDGVPSIIVPVPDHYFVEEFIHLPMLAHPEPEKLLFISGGAGGMINEALKHPTVTAITYAELDPLLLALFEKFPIERQAGVDHQYGRTPPAQDDRQHLRRDLSWDSGPIQPADQPVFHARVLSTGKGYVEPRRDSRYRAARFADLPQRRHEGPEQLHLPYAGNGVFPYQGHPG